MAEMDMMDDPPIDPELKGDDRRKEAASNLYALFKAYSEDPQRQYWQGVWEMIYAAYNGYKPSGSPYQTNYVIREVFRETETVIPQVTRQLFSGSKLFNYQAMHDGFEAQARGATQIVHQQIRRGRIDREMYRWVGCSIKYGLSYLTYGWHNFKRNKLKLSKMYYDGQESWWKRETDELIEEAPYAEWLPPWSVFSHPWVEDCRNSPAVFVQKAVSPAYLKTLVRDGFIDSKVTQEILEGQDSGGGDIFQQQHPSHEDATGLNHSPQGDGPLEFLLCWTVDGWEYVLINRTHLVRAHKIEDGQIPLIALQNYPQEEEHYGRPDPWIILEEQRMLNDFMSMFADSVHYVLNPMFKCRRSAVKDFRGTMFRPGGIIELDNMEDVQPMTVPPVAMDITNVGAFVLNQMKAAPGVTDELAGTGSRAKTATMGVRLQEAAGVRMEHKVRLAMWPFQDVYAAFYNLNARHLNQDVAVRLEGDDGRAAFARYGPNVFDADIDVEVELSNQNSGPEMAARWQQMYMSCGQDPLVNRGALLERWFRALGEKRPKALLASPLNDQSDALKENENFRVNGVSPKPEAQENHELHLQMHAMFAATPVGQTMPPEWQMAVQEHMAVHQIYLQQMQQQMGQASQQSSQAPSQGSPVPEADAQTEAMFANGATGAMEQGAMQQNVGDQLSGIGGGDFV